MRHLVKGRHLGRTAAHRRALYRNLVAALFEHGRIRTTDAKAREVRPLAEKMITLGKRGDLHARRQALRVVGGGTALERLFGPIAQRFADRPGGYTRLVKAGRRHGDGARVAYLELLDEAPRVVRAAGAGEGEVEPPSRARGRAPAARAGGRGAARRTRAGAGGSSAAGSGGRRSRKEARTAEAGASGEAKATSKRASGGGSSTKAARKKGEAGSRSTGKGKRGE